YGGRLRRRGREHREQRGAGDPARHRPSPRCGHHRLPGAAGPVPVRAGPAPGPRHRTGDPGAAPGPGATVTGRSTVPGPAPGSGGPGSGGPGPADPGPADPAAGLDLRLVPAAAVGWVVCGVGVGLGADAGWLGVLVLLVAAAGGLHRQRTRVRAR